MSPDLRPLHVRVKALANRFDAIAIGADKRAYASKQDADNARRDAAVLHEAARRLEPTP
jgi:hypothetical protein